MTHGSVLVVSSSKKTKKSFSFQNTEKSEKTTNTKNTQKPFLGRARGTRSLEKRGIAPPKFPKKTKFPKPSQTSALQLDTPSLNDRRKLILQLMWPALAENALSTLVSMADTIMVSALGTGAIAAVGLITQPRFIMLSALMALGTGTTALVARAIGAGNPQKANRVLKQSLLLAVLGLVLVCSLMYCFRLPLIRFVAGDSIAQSTILRADDYFRIQILGFPLLGLTAIMNAALRGAGNTRAAFYSNGLSNLVNIAGNWLLISGRYGFPALGIRGASIATVIGQLVAFVFCLYLLLRGKQRVRLHGSLLPKPDLPTIRTIGSIGLPALAEQLLLRVGMMIFTLIVTSLGDDDYATHIIAMNIQSLSFSIGMSFGVAATTLTGQCLGLRRADLARWYVKQTNSFSLAASLLVSLLLFFGGAQLASLYAQPGQTAIIAKAALVLKMMAVVNPLSNSRFVHNSALRGAGDARFTALSTFLGVMLLRPIAAYLLVFVFYQGLIGVWIALCSDSLLCYALARMRWHSGRWTHALRETAIAPDPQEEADLG